MRSLALKLTLAFLMVALVGSALTAFLINRRTSSEFDRLLLDLNRDPLVANLRAYYSLTGSWAGVGERLRPDEDLPPQARRLLTRFILVDADRRIVFGGREQDIGRQVNARQIAQGVPVEIDGQTVGWLIPNPNLREALPAAPEVAFLRRINQATLLSALAATVLALAFGSLLAFSLTRSLRELTAATQRLAQGDLGAQVEVRSQDELGELAASFNSMSADLAQATAARRQMTADIAHELRNPLSVILGYTEALDEGKLRQDAEIYTVLHAEARQLSRLVDDLRTLSLAEAGELPLTRQTLPPGELLQRVAAAQRRIAQEKGLTLEVDVAPDLPSVYVDPDRLDQALTNLVTNAIRHTPTGGAIHLSALPSGNRIALQVHDTGEGIQPGDLPHVFDRFYRADRARAAPDASGLGLAITRSIVLAHGGEISAESQPGAGAAFTVYLPSA